MDMRGWSHTGLYQRHSGKAWMRPKLVASSSALGDNCQGLSLVLGPLGEQIAAAARVRSAT